MIPIKQSQIVRYDAASRDDAAKLLEQINTAGLNADAINQIEALIRSARALRVELCHVAHAAFIRARMGEVMP